MTRAKPRPTQATFRRRRLVAVLILVSPLLLVLRACNGTESGAAPTPTPSRATTVAPSATQSPVASPTPTPTPTVSTAPALRACDNDDIRVTVTTDRSTYGIGERVTMQMRIENVGDTACRRDVGALANELYIVDADDVVVWSSDACQKDAKLRLVTMRPGAAFGNTQTWTGSNTGRGCSSLAADAVEGEYRAFARNDTVVSAAAAFTLG